MGRLNCVKFILTQTFFLENICKLLTTIFRQKLSTGFVVIGLPVHGCLSAENYAHGILGKIIAVTNQIFMFLIIKCIYQKVQNYLCIL
jgi:hypothetical protein